MISPSLHVHVHGNCQAPAIAALIGEQFADWHITSDEVFGQRIIDDIDRYVALIRRADIVISQPIHDGYRNEPRLSLRWIREAISPGAALVVFPSMFFDGQLVGCRSLPIPGFGMDYHDALVVHLAACGFGAVAIARVLLAEDLYPEAFIRHEIALSINQLRLREAADGIDVPLSRHLVEHALQQQIFHVINHPSRAVLVFMANQILQHLGFRPAIPVAGEDFLRRPHIPVLPSVRRLFRGPAQPQGREPHDPLRYHFDFGSLDPLTYYQRAVADLARHSPVTLANGLNSGGIRPFLARVAQAGLAVPQIVRWRGFGTVSALGQR